MLRYTLYWGKWALGAIALAYTAIGVGVANWGTPGVATSVWASAIWLLQWVAFPGGIAVGFCVPVLVVHGLTRRTATAGGALAVIGLALGTAAMVQVGLAVEWLIYRAAGVPYRVGGGHLFRTIDQVHLVLAEHALNLAAFLVTGLLIFLVYYRLGGWWGTLALPLTLLLPAGAVLALSAGGATGPVRQESPPWVDRIGVAPALALALAAVAAGLLAVHALTRTIPITSR